MFAYAHNFLKVLCNTQLYVILEKVAATKCVSLQYAHTIFLKISLKNDSVVGCFKEDIFYFNIYCPQI